MAFDFEKPQPLADAVEQISKKTPIGAALSSSQWENDVPAALKDSAMFSAKVESVRAMQQVKDDLTTLLKLSRDPKTGAFEMDRGKFIERIQKTANRLGLRTKEQEKKGSVQDFGSERRLKLIYEQQIGAAQGKAFYLQGQDSDVLNTWPAQELVRVADRKKKRDWKRRWHDAASAVGFQGVSKSAMAAGRLIALKTSPIWIQLSRFQRPYPPFDFNSGMGVQEIDREEAEQWELLKPGDVLEPNAQDYQDKLAASAAGLDTASIDALQKAFGDQLTVQGDTVHWTGSGSQPGPAPKPAPEPKPIVPPKPETPPTAEPKPKPQTEVAPEPPAPVVEAPAKPVPQGPAVSAAAEIDVAKTDMKKIRAVFDAIDKIHGDGELKTIPINRKVSRSADGTYYSVPTEARAIGVRKGSPIGNVGLAHEVGHWLDHIGIPSKTKFASESVDPRFASWNAVVRSSPTFQKLLASPPSKYRDYMISGRELWARAYSQFIAVESGIPAMVAEIEYMRSPASGFGVNSQWPAEEFTPIAEEFRKLFQTLGWMK